MQGTTDARKAFIEKITADSKAEFDNAVEAARQMLADRDLAEAAAEADILAEATRDHQ